MIALQRAASAARRIVAGLHLWIGLVLCAPLAVLGLSGSILVLAEGLGPPAAPAAAAVGAPHAVAEILAAARRAAPPGYLPILYAPPPAPGRTATVRLARPGHTALGAEVLSLAIDPVSLAVIPPPPAERLLAVLRTLHTSLFLPDRRVLGALGLAMLALGLSGLVNWWPRRRRWRATLAVNLGARGPRLYRELHAATGIWALIVFLAVSFSGVSLAFPQSVHAVVSLALPARDLRAAALRVAPVPGASPLSVDAAIALAEASAPGTRLGLVALPVAPDRPFRIGLIRAGHERAEPMITVLVDPWRDRIVRRLDPARFSLGETVLGWQHALHAGEGLGPVWQSLVFLTGLLPLFFAVTGSRLWWLRRRARRALLAAQGSASTRCDASHSAAE
jgi:uncharacterized iron-regulated membrane protein